MRLASLGGSFWIISLRDNAIGHVLFLVNIKLISLIWAEAAIRDQTRT
jgi:hypothetical protein